LAYFIFQQIQIKKRQRFLAAAYVLPALLTPMSDPFTIAGFIEFVLTAVAASFLYTWVFNWR